MSAILRFFFGIKSHYPCLNDVTLSSKVLLLEKFDFCKGTSSRSTKLIHGGVRYLEKGQFRLVYQALKERDVLFDQNIVLKERKGAQTIAMAVIQLNEFTVTSIMSFNDLGVWTADRSKAHASSSYPHDGTNYIDPLYLEGSHNPFVAQLSTNFLVGFAPTVQEQAHNSSTPSKFSKKFKVPLLVCPKIYQYVLQFLPIW